MHETRRPLYDKATTSLDPRFHIATIISRSP
jgi:hypothetical protein